MSRRKPTKKDLLRISPDLQKLPLVHLSDLAMDPTNARLHPGRNLDAIKASLQEYGQRENLVVNFKGHVIEAGNGRLEAAIALGWNYLAVSFEDDTPNKASAYSIAANRTAELAFWNDPQLEDTMTRLQEDGFDLDTIGFSDEEFQDLLNRLHPSEPPPPIELPKTSIEAGDVIQVGTHRIICGDSLTVIAGMSADTIDAMVTDPPSGISFMGKAWDSDRGGRDKWIQWLESIMVQALRVLKPGAHGLVWAIPRTSHWTGQALEQAGFEIRDMISHVFGTGFPKSLDVSKAIDDRDIPVTSEAKQWNGWGTAIKPAHEVWILVRKPLIGTVAQNVLEHGTGGLNIEGCKVGTDLMGIQKGGYSDSPVFGTSKGGFSGGGIGRWPPNLLLTHSPDCTDTDCVDGCPVSEMDRQSGLLKSGKLSPSNNVKRSSGWSGGSQANRVKNTFEANIGGASRFFPVFRYQAKPSSREKKAGLDTPNVHPTVKPIALMSWLSRLITPPGGTVLDPFCGSGTTGLACIEQGFHFVGIEQNPEYADIARQRMKHHHNNKEEQT